MKIEVVKTKTTGDGVTGYYAVDSADPDRMLANYWFGSPRPDGRVVVMRLELASFGNTEKTGFGFLPRSAEVISLPSVEAAAQYAREQALADAVKFGGRLPTFEDAGSLKPETK